MEKDEIEKIYGWQRKGNPQNPIQKNKNPDPEVFTIEVAEENLRIMKETLAHAEPYKNVK
jgi:hypothetical protein